MNVVSAETEGTLTPETVLAEIQRREQNARPDFDSRFDVPNLTVLAKSMEVPESQILQARIAGVQANTYLGEPLKQQTLNQLRKDLGREERLDELLRQAYKIEWLND